MRKYHQAALAVIAAVSLISLLIYRHEYNKLRYVLEVFNYFGKPTLQNLDSNYTNTFPIFSKLNLQLEEPFASWQRIDDTLYVYSAYSIKRNEIQAVSFGSLATIKDVQCVVIFDTDAKPVPGSSTYTAINNTLNTLNLRLSDYGGYNLHCAYVENKVPIGVKFLTKTNANVDDSPMLSVKSQTGVLGDTNTALCVTPAENLLDSINMISFINFHDLIGVNNFIIYDNGIPNNFHSHLRDVATAQNPYWKFTYTVVPWNFPFHGLDHNVMNNIIQADCLYRTYNKATYVVILSWDEYLVLKYHHSIVDLLVDYNKSRIKRDSYKLTPLHYCTQQPDDMRFQNSNLTIFKKTHYDPSITDSNPTFIYLPHKILSKSVNYIHQIGNDLVVVNKYKHCYNYKETKESISDSSILRFMEDLQNSSIYKKFVKENGFALN